MRSGLVDADAPLVWRVEIVCAGNITSASAKPGPSALLNDAPLHMFQRPTFQLSYSSRFFYFRHFPFVTSLLLFFRCSNTCLVSPASGLYSIGTKIGFPKRLWRTFDFFNVDPPSKHASKPLVTAIWAIGIVLH